MNLHRTTGKPDWDNVSPATRSIFQKVAAATNGILSPANIISVLGLGLVVYGLVEIINQQFWLGLVFVAIGRLLDIVDGAVAEATHTKSPLGELVDASIDKIGTLLTIITLFVANIADWWVIVILLLPQVIIPVIIFFKRRKGINVHPTRVGKVSMALVWVSVVGLLLVKALGYMMTMVFGVYVIAVLSLVLGMYALWQYATGRD